MALSFLAGRKTSAVARVTASAVTGGGLEMAKAKIIKAISSQKALVDLVVDGRSIPKKTDGRTVVWFFKESDGSWWTALRYGQSVIPLEDNNSYVEIGSIENMNPFYDSVIAAIERGEMDAIIERLRKKRTDALARGRGRAPAMTAPTEAPETEDSSQSEATKSSTGKRQTRKAAAE